MSEPYYQDEAVTLYLGDCLVEVTEWLDADVLVTDPPYGIGWTQRGTYQATSGKTDRVKRNVIAGDSTTAARDTVLRQWGSRPAMVFGSWKAARPPSVSHRLIWDKRGAFPGPLNAPFFSVDEEVYVIGGGFRSSSPPQRSVITTHERRSEAVLIGHPTPKPVQLMELLIDRCPSGVVADPFAGSGSTLLAARNLGRRAIGVEIHEPYCELIAKRLDQMCLDFGAPA